MSELQTVWSWLPAIYFFLGGLGAGAFCTVAVLALVTGERFRGTVRFGAWTATVVTTAGTLALLLDVGAPWRALVLFKSFVNFQSWMTIGAWFLFAAILLQGLYALLWTDGVLQWSEGFWKPLREKRALWRALVAAIGILVSLVVAAYTGILLGVLPFRPFWNTWLLPALFTASALETGTAVVTAHASLREQGEGVERLRKVLEVSITVLIVIEAAILGYYVLSAVAGSLDSSRAARLLTRGALGPIFWILVVGLGLVVPFFICVTRLSGLTKRRTALLPVAGIASCLLGAFSLRSVILWAGIPASLSSPGLSQITAGIRFIP
ncbi:MAG: polysulfide reductase NrfD [Candidatus Tectomicrobia bacterium]|uniref:Polysulfide reductase NrfD n=1 Tax=Tectimicrobiota bacterium TaxID=2528274 RepID=A0A932GNW7_UNCTE|nr:polysulfide reductase NrfD [Candidatus Tectomicrobia bacterium]